MRKRGRQKGETLRKRREAERERERNDKMAKGMRVRFIYIYSKLIRAHSHACSHRRDKLLSRLDWYFCRWVI